MGDWVNGLPVGAIMVGGQMSKVGSTTIVTNGFEGCIQDIRVGNSANSILVRPIMYNAVEGCEAGDPCDRDLAFPCPPNSYCNNEWRAHTCTCQPGEISISGCYIICILLETANICIVATLL